MNHIKRLDYIDICKFLGISLVIFGHMKMPNELLQWIYAFHMPLFFVISGYTYHPQPFDKQFILKKIKTIYIPFLLFALIFCQDNICSWDYILYGSRNTLLMAKTETIYWFLSCFFIAVITFSILMITSNKTDKKKQFAILCCGIILFLMIAKICEYIKSNQPFINKYGYPFNFDMALIGTIFMVIGYYLKQLLDWLNKQKKWVLPTIVIVLYTISSFTTFTNLPQSVNPDYYHIDMAGSIIGNWWLFFFNASILSFATIGLSVLIDNLIKQKKLLIFIGQNTLTILCTHGVILTLISILPIMGFNTTNDWGLLLRGIISYLIVITASIPIILLIKRFAPNLVGK